MCLRELRFWPKFLTAFFDSGNVMTREIVEYCHGGGCLKESKHFLVSQALPSLCPLLLHVPLHALLSNKRSGRLYRWPCSSQLSQWELLAWEASLALRPPTIVLGLNRRPESVLAFGLNAKAQGPNQSGR